MGYISLYTIDIALKEIAGFTETKTLYEKNLKLISKELHGQFAF